MDGIIELFEADAMVHIVAENPDLSEDLLKQYRASKVTGRKFTGFGFYTNFEITNKELRLIERQNLELGDTQAKIKGLELGAGFVLFIRDGLITSLECYTYDEPWPKKITEYSIG